MNPTPIPPTGRGWAAAAFGVALAVSLAAVAAVALTRSPPAPGPEPDLAAEAVADLRKSKPDPLSGPLAKLLAESRPKLVSTQPHPLLGKPAPGFALANADGRTESLADHLARGPVILVFYLGYSCDHCVSQLFGLDEDLGYFRELGAVVLAVSGDTIERTRAQYAKYRPFHFPALADPDRTAAQRYGVYAPAGDGRRKWDAHGTFVIDRTGTVRWANTGDEPFTHNPTLLWELTALDGRQPAPTPDTDSESHHDSRRRHEEPNRLHAD